MPAWTINSSGGYDPVGDSGAAPNFLYTSQGLTAPSSSTSSSPASTSGSTASGTGTSSDNMLDPTQASATLIIQNQLQQWGLDSLSGTVSDLIRQGYGTDAITLQLQQTDAYKQRFSANDIRQKNGLSVLSPADYISAENSYRQVLQQYGLPSSFYDSNDDLAQFIGKDVSPSEVNERAKDAQQVWLSTDTNTQSAWKSYYGLTDGAAIATILDPDKALPIVQRMTAASQIGGAALQNGLAAPDAARAENLADLGVTQAAAQKGYGQIGQTLGNVEGAASRFGTSWNQTDAENATLLQDSSAQRKQSDIADAEKALFSGRSSADNNTMNQRTSGSY